jgi:putative Holliday junction resolvase
VRIVGLDVGERRIGVAVSDVSRTLARPLGVLRPVGLDLDAVQVSADEIARLAREEDGVASIVVGLPRRLDGTATDMTQRVEHFARQLEARTALPVTLQDERLSSREAESRLALREKDWRKRKQRIDAAAAAVILQDYLDAVRKSVALIVLVAVLAGGVAAVAVWLWERIHEPYRNYSGSEQFVTIRQGAGSGEIGRQLSEAQVVSDARLFRGALWWSGQGRNLKAGEYRFDRPLSTLEVIDILVRGDVYARRITFPEGLTIEEMSKLYESRDFGAARRLHRCGEERRADQGPGSGSHRSRRLPVPGNVRAAARNPGVAPD